MLNSFDWLRRSRSGAELLATLEYIADTPDLSADGQEIGGPHSALSSPCRRCWVHARIAPDQPHCRFCRTIVAKARSLGHVSRRSVVIWGFVNQMPHQLRSGGEFDSSYISGMYVPDGQHFLLMLSRRGLRPWIQDLILYNGAELKGLVQIFPTTGKGKGLDMSDIMGRVIHREASFPMNQLRVRFYGAPYQVVRHFEREREGLLTFDVSDFLGLLEMAAVFRSVLRVTEQDILYQLLTAKDLAEEQFFWGRFLGLLNQEAKDMLHAWKVRQWSKHRVKLLYELVNYVYIDFPWLD